MVIDLFYKETGELFASIGISEKSLNDFHKGDANAFLKKTAKNYASIQKEAVVAKSAGLKDISANP
jgi:hypothetical protein